MIANLDEHMALHHAVQSTVLVGSSDNVGESGEGTADVIDLSKDVPAPPENENLLEDAFVDDGLPGVVSTEDCSIPDVDNVSECPEPKDSLAVGKIVLVQKKSLHWPARILGLNGSKCLVKYFDGQGAKCKILNICTYASIKFLSRPYFLLTPYMQGAKCEILHICTRANVKYLSRP